jgi:nucleotidyltransferase substrate binding protein (TIGR01987 family)
MSINIAPLQKAFASLSKALNRALNDPEDLEVRDGSIQRFEYTYELSVKLLKRYIEEEAPTTENVDQLNFKDLLRISAEIGLIQDVNLWFSFRAARNNTSHAYDELKAEEVFSVLPVFVSQVQLLIDEFNKRI